MVELAFYLGCFYDWVKNTPYSWVRTGFRYQVTSERMLS